MATDPRAEFMRKSKILADGGTVTDRDDEEEIRLDRAKDPRELFMRASRSLAGGKSLSDVKRLCADAFTGHASGHRDRFIHQSRMLAQGDAVDIRFASETRLDADPAARRVQRTSESRLIFRTDLERLDEEKEDPREALLKKLAALGR